jgi:hypothetical protein
MTSKPGNQRANRAVVTSQQTNKHRRQALTDHEPAKLTDRQ